MQVLVRRKDQRLVGRAAIVARKLMIFSPWCYGHHPSYLRHLLNYWSENNLSGTLHIVVLPDFMQAHVDVVELATKCKSERVQFVPMSVQEQTALVSKPSGFDRAIQQYRLIDKYATLLQATQGLVIYFDSCQIPFVLGARLPCPISGIYYRPTFHYHHFTAETLTWKERRQKLREKIFLWRILHNPSFKSLFCLDPLVIEPLKNLSGNSKALYLPDPVQPNHATPEQAAKLRRQLGISPDRKVFLCFGRLSESRKGVPQLVEAISLIPPDLCQNLCLLFAGEPEGAGKEQLESWLDPLRQSHPVQIVSQYGYISESEVQTCFHAADVVLAPYQKHIGMSGILLQAAAAQKPILSSDYGLMGEMVHRYGLGLTVDTTIPSELAKGITRCLLQPLGELGDRDQMQAFADEHSADHFARIIFEHT